MRSVTWIPIVFLNSKQSILISKTLAERNGLHTGDDLKTLTSGGVVTFKVRGLLADSGPARIFGGAYALMYLDAAQAIFGREGTYYRIDVVTTEPAAPVIEAMKKVVGERARVERPQRRSQRMEQFLASLDVGMLVLALVAVFVGMFLVYNTVSTSVAERRRDIGILRATGMTREQVVALFSLESALLGAVAGVLGVPAGVLLGRAAMSVMQHQIEMVLPMTFDHVFTRPSHLFLAWLIGIAAAALAALPPALSAARVSPRDAIEHGSIVAKTESHQFDFAPFGAALMAASGLSSLPALRQDKAAVYGSEIAIVLGLVALSP